jgi:formate-dependent nitrite reductase membrane component NrfD
MLLQSEVVEEAFEQGWPWSLAGWHEMAYAPMLKVWSPMSIGAWALFVFGAFSFASCWASVRPQGRIARLLNSRVVRWPWRLAGSGVGFFIASYTGVLLTATNQPLWSQTDWLGALFLTSATSTALATLVLLSRRREPTDPTVEHLERAHRWALVCELVVFIMFLLSLGPLLSVLLPRNAGILLLVGPLGLGILWPLGHQLVTSARYAPSRALAVLVGGLALRYAVILGAPELRQQQPPNVTAGVPVGTPAGWHAVSPEDGRPRGGGPGASALNRTDSPQPRTKVFDAAKP